jgi:hypothetical protein
MTHLMAFALQLRIDAKLTKVFDCVEASDSRISAIVVPKVKFEVSEDLHICSCF